MAFNTLSSKKLPSVEEMRKKMKSKGGVHVDPLLGESERAKPVVDGKKRGRKAVKIYTSHFSTYLSKDQENALYNWCEANGVTPSVAIRMAVQKLVSEDN